MAIITETLIIGGHSFIKTYSDKGVKVHGGFPEGDYDEANDPAEFGRVYVETDVPINEGKEDLNPERILNILLGEEEE